MTAIKAKRPLASLSQAKSNFVASVQEGIEELMNRCGYSRERATHTLLRELGRGGDSPTDHEIFHLMELQGLGMDEACKALVVSKAVRRLMKEQGVSVVEALDDLIQKLSFSNIMASASPPKIKIQSQFTDDKPQDDLLITPLRPRQSTTILSQLKARTLTKPILQPPTSKYNSSTTKPESHKIKNPRKRSVSEENSANKEGRARADSVTEEVNAKLETRPKQKRDAVAVVAQPAAKRPREA